MPLLVWISSFTLSVPGPLSGPGVPRPPGDECRGTPTPICASSVFSDCRRRASSLSSQAAQASISSISREISQASFSNLPIPNVTPAECRLSCIFLRLSGTPAILYVSLILIISAGVGRSSSASAPPSFSPDAPASASRCSVRGSPSTRAGGPLPPGVGGALLPTELTAFPLGSGRGRSLAWRENSGLVD
jgi:hypothetical protein